MICAAVMCDLYMRDQIEIHHWTLQEGSTAVPYQVSHRKGGEIVVPCEDLDTDTSICTYRGRNDFNLFL